MKALLRTLHAPVYERRLEVLLKVLGDCLPRGESLLDIGCGAGTLGDGLAREYGLEVRGLETNTREGCAIPVEPYDGETIPYEDDSIDNVLLADVLHHEEKPERLLQEAGRVARRRGRAVRGALFEHENFGDFCKINLGFLWQQSSN